MSVVQLPNPLRDALMQVNDASLAWQLGLIGVSLALAWLITHTLTRRLATHPETGAKLAGFTQVFFPLSVLALLLIGKAILQHWLPVAFINLLIPLALALTLIRATSHILRMAFAPSELVQLIKQAVTWLVVLGLALHLSGLNHEVVNALDDLGINIGKQRISLLLVLEGVLSMLATVVIALWVGRLIETRVMRAKTLELNLRIVLAKIIRALLMLVGVLIALPLAGIDITFLSVFGGALGVGLGFGLQKTASNYISGFIILLDRSVRIGDVVTVDNKYGEITQITNRYTVVKSLDGTEAIIPNETMITSTVVNHSFTTRDVRMNLAVQISYASSLEQAMMIMKRVALSHPRVLQQPVPEVFLKEFGDNGLLLDLVVWISDPEQGQLNLRSALNLDIWREFQAAGIEIPYPRRDIRVVDFAANAVIPSS
jgi:small-conductance mechanosensitive channel